MKINRTYRRPEQGPGESFFDMCKRINTKIIKVTGMVGAGTKVHNLTVQYVDTDKGMGLVSVWSLCGSAKWNSRVNPVFNAELECTCTRCNANAYRSNEYNTEPNAKETKMKKVTVTAKQIKAAIDEINTAQLGTTMMVGKKPKKDDLIKVLLSGIKEVDEAGKLDNVPDDAWDTYRVLVPKGEEKDETTTVNYEDTPEGKATAKAKGKVTNKKPAPAKPAKPAKETKAQAFWRVLTTMATTTQGDKPIWVKADLAEALRTAHGNGSEPEAKFWTQNYLNLLAAAGLVAVEGKTVTVV